MGRESEAFQEREERAGGAPTTPPPLTNVCSGVSAHTLRTHARSNTTIEGTAYVYSDDDDDG